MKQFHIAKRRNLPHTKKVNSIRKSPTAANFHSFPNSLNQCILVWWQLVWSVIRFCFAVVSTLEDSKRAKRREREARGSCISGPENQYHIKLVVYGNGSGCFMSTMYCCCQKQPYAIHNRVLCMCPQTFALSHTSQCSHHHTQKVQSEPKTLIRDMNLEGRHMSIIQHPQVQEKGCKKKQKKRVQFLISGAFSNITAVNYQSNFQKQGSRIPTEGVLFYVEMMSPPPSSLSQDDVRVRRPLATLSLHTQDIGVWTYPRCALKYV